MTVLDHRTGSAKILRQTQQVQKVVAAASVKGYVLPTSTESRMPNVYVGHGGPTLT